MDEPCGSIDPVASAHVEALILELKTSMPVVIITHNMEQARRVADRVAFFRLGEMLEVGPTEAVFTAPASHWTRDFIGGAYG
jgi:phosphate transport system ATP-binding protein